MNTRKLIIIILWLPICLTGKAQTWSEWFEQKKTQREYLLQQIAKLQVYLSYLRKGYNIVNDGLSFIGDIKNGDFNLHKGFFDKLKIVNPKIKRYWKVADIIVMQVKMMAAYKDHYKRLRQSVLFNNLEVDYFYQVFTNLLDKVADDTEELTATLADGRLEMSDSERINRIDGLHKAVSEKYSSLFSLIDHITLLAKQREKELADLQTLKKLYEP